MKVALLARAACLVVLWAALFGTSTASNPNLLITEVMFHTNYDDYFEYIEIYCLPSANSTISLAGWSILEVGFTFPSGASIKPGEYRLVVANVYQFLRSRNTTVDPSVYGGYTTYLSNSKSSVTLVDTANVTQVSMAYDDSDAVLADGFGSSWELRCYDTRVQNTAYHWINSPVPLNIDRHVEYGGTPGAPNTWQVCLPVQDAKGPPKQVYITEIMYHPIGSISMQEDFEFIELLNNGLTAIDISHWRLVAQDSVRFLFPSNTVVQPGQYIVVAKNVNAFLSTYTSLPGPSSQVYGPYDGELSNSGDVVVLVDNYGQIHESVNYGDSGDWPLSADAFGASQSDLYPTHPYISNYTSYLYKGLGLSRRSLTWGSSKAYNWDAVFPSPLAANFDTSATLLPRFQAPTFSPDLIHIYATSDVTITTQLSPWPITGVTLSSVTLVWFVDDLVSDTPAPSSKTTITMTETIVDSGNYTGVITAAQIRTAAKGNSESSVVRITIKATFTDGRTLLSPPVVHPYQYHSFFIFPPPDPSGTESTHLFIRPSLWSTLRPNAEGGGSADTRRVYSTDACTVRTEFDANVPTTVIYSKDGRVIDQATVRYQGSRWNRPNGVDIGTAFPQGPPAPGIKAYSYRISIPRFADWDGGRDITIHKMYQGCTMYETPLLNQLCEDTGVMGSPISFIKLWINKGFLRYMMLVWSGGKDWITRWQDIQNKRCVHQTTETMGHFFKAKGNNGVTEGPFGRGDWSVLPASCSGKWSEEQRYDYTYERKSWNDIYDSKMVYDAIHTINDNILGNTGGWSAAQKKTWLQNNVDINLMLNYIVLINWAGTWDQVIHNQYMYRSAQTGKWSWHPWDADAMFEATSFNQDLYSGDTSNVVFMRRAVIQNFKSELQDRYRLFQATILSKTNMTNRITERNQAYNRTLAAQGYGVETQNLATCITNINNFINGRWNYVNTQLGALSSSVNIGAELERVWCPDKPEVTRVYNTFTAPPAVPLVPSANPSKTSVALSWFPPNGFGSAQISYTIQRSTDGISYSTVGTVSAASAASRPPLNPVSLTDGNLNSSTTYYYRVRADSSSGNSNWLTLTATTQDYCLGFNQSYCLSENTCRWCGNAGSYSCKSDALCTPPSIPLCYQNLPQSECNTCLDSNGVSSWRFVDGQCMPFPSGPCAGLSSTDCGACIASSSQCGYCEWTTQSSCAPTSYACSGTWLTTSCGVSTFMIFTKQSQENATQILETVIAASVGAPADSVALTPGSTPGSFQVTVTYSGTTRGDSGTKVDQAIRDPTVIGILGAQEIFVSPPPDPVPEPSPGEASSSVSSDASSLQPWIWGVIGASIAVVIIIVVIVIVVALKRESDMTTLA